MAAAAERERAERRRLARLARTRCSLVAAMPGKPLLSLTTRDIAGATPTPLERFTNKPPKEEVAGSKSKSNLLGWNRPVMNLETHDISGNDSGKSHFLANSTRSVNPLNPTYALPAVRPTPTPEPKFLRNTLDWTDVPGMKPRDFYSKQPRDQISCADIEGSGVGTTPRSKARKTLSKRRPVTSLDVHDISGGKFVSTRVTNPLEPEYVMRCESSLGYMGRGAAEHARKSKMDTLERKPSLHTTNLERPNPDTERLSASEKLLASTGSGPTALMKVGKVERSHPGWRPTYANKYYENGVRMKDASLRSDDIPGTQQLPSNSFLTTSGGVWRKTDRPRRGVRNSIPTDDIDDGGTGRGAQAMLKKDSMHRSLGRQSDPGDPVYIPLDGVQKAGGLLEREILSKTVNARKSIQTSHAINPDENVARQLAGGGRLSDSLLQSAFKSADLRKTGKVSYPTFVQGINALGVAMPAKDVVELAKQLDTEGTGQVDYSKLPGHLKQAYEKRVKFEAEETAKRLSMVEKKSEPATTSISPMMKLKDKLYRKNEKLYKSFGMFDLDKQGSITTERFADTVDMLNVSLHTCKTCTSNVMYSVLRMI